MKKTYHIVNRGEKTATASIEQFAKSNGQLLLPLLELITQARVAVDEVISSIGRKTIETILTLSAEHVAGAQTPGKISGDIRWHGSQNGRGADAGEDQRGHPLARLTEWPGRARRPPAESEAPAASPQAGRRSESACV